MTQPAEGVAMVTECCGVPIAATCRFCQKCGYEARVLPSVVAPPDWKEFVVAAFNEGWAAKQSDEFTDLAHAFAESHVKLQFGLIEERAVVAPSQEPQWQPIMTGGVIRHWADPGKD